MDTQEYVKELMGEDEELDLVGKCHDCGIESCMTVRKTGGDLLFDGPFWHNDSGDFCKCLECFDVDPVLRNYRKCEVYSRVTGYLRPVSYWNKGKKEEFKMRKTFKTNMEVDNAN